MAIPRLAAHRPRVGPIFLLRGWALLLLATGMTAAPAWADPPAPIDAEACRARIPAESAAPAHIRDIWQGWVNRICVESEAASDGAWQSCILRRIRPTSGVNLQRVADAYNECNPTAVACAERTRAFTRGLGAKAREFLRGVCFSSPDTPDSEYSCLSENARNAEFLSAPIGLRIFCAPTYQPCIRTLLAGRGGEARASAAWKRVAAHSCADLGYTGDTEPSCALEIFNAGLGNADDAGRIAREFCGADRRPRADRRSCALGALRDARLRLPAAPGAQAGYHDWRREAQDAWAFCSIPSPEAQACVLRLFDQGRGMPIGQARYACRYRSEPVRSCLRDFMAGAAPFSSPNLNRDREDFAMRADRDADRDPEAKPGFFESLLGGTTPNRTTAEHICSISNLPDRACVLRSYDFFARSSNGHAGSLGTAVASCTGREEQRVCLQSIRDGLQLAVLGPAIVEMGGPSIDAWAICEIPTYEIRSCVISNLEKMLYRRESQAQLEAACHAGFVTGLLGAANSSPYIYRADAGCEFDRNVR
ncbi:MAG: hypothetical protein IT285_14235 [Bdellovibrionales bacterium]|nr:hypothetical protein [Bdellovibrionales bacterium]